VNTTRALAEYRTNPLNDLAYVDRLIEVSAGDRALPRSTADVLDQYDHYSGRSRWTSVCTRSTMTGSIIDPTAFHTQGT